MKSNSRTRLAFAVLLTVCLGSNLYALKKKITDYYKAWINMARCHGSDSYVTLPGRNYADESYYSGNIRNHTTGSIAFLYSFSTPKLRLQGCSPESSKIQNTDKPQAGGI